MHRYLILAAMIAAPMAAGAAELPKDKARLTVGLPTYVHHPDGRTGGRDWNEGWFQNEGVLADVSWPVHKLGNDTTVRLGGTLGGFDNSEFKTSIFLGGMAEVETFATDHLAFSLGTYAGAITGYSGVIPAIAPYLGTSYAVNDHLEIGLRGFWLPGKTFAGPDMAESDAYVGAFTIGTRF